MKCHLIDHNYVPDSINLNKSYNEEAKNYWLDCLAQLIKKIANQALLSEGSSPEAQIRSSKFTEDYLLKINENKQKSASEVLSVRILLGWNEKLLQQNGFDDPWRDQKRLANLTSLKILKPRLECIDNIQNPDERWIELFRGILAGNVFDWGAIEVQKILENSNSNFGFNEALNKIESRPYLVDGIDDWLERMKESPQYSCAAIFIDNSGPDLILGVFPFIREILKQNTEVMLCANSKPALNDVTYSELIVLMDDVCQECDILKKAYKSKKLMIFENGQNGCCLDFNHIPDELNEAMIEHKTDLLILEGMGRALHTNLYANFNIDTLKLAVIKNLWMAQRLRGNIFSVICKYEEKSKLISKS